MLQNNRKLAGLGEVCYNLFDCAGNLNCCTSQGLGACYVSCDRSATTVQAGVNTGYIDPAFIDTSYADPGLVDLGLAEQGAYTEGVAGGYVNGPVNTGYIDPGYVDLGLADQVGLGVPISAVGTSTSANSANNLLANDLAASELQKAETLAQINAYPPELTATSTSTLPTITVNPHLPLNSPTFPDGEYDYSSYLANTQVNIQQVQAELDLLAREKQRLEDEEAKLEFLEKLNIEQAGLELELAQLYAQDEEIERLQRAIVNDQLNAAPVTTNEGQIVCARSGNTEGCVSPINYASGQIIAKADGSLIDDGLQTQAIVAISVGAALIILIFLAFGFYYIRSQKRKNTSDRVIQMQQKDYSNHSSHSNPRKGYPQAPATPPHNKGRIGKPNHAVYMNESQGPLGPTQESGVYDDTPDILGGFNEKQPYQMRNPSSGKASNGKRMANKA